MHATKCSNPYLNEENQWQNPKVRRQSLLRVKLDIFLLNLIFVALVQHY